MGSLNDALADARNESYEEGYAAGISDTKDRVLDLISRKKAEYAEANPSAPTSVGERAAVIAALETLHAHVRTKLLPKERP